MNSSKCFLLFLFVQSLWAKEPIYLNNTGPISFVTKKIYAFGGTINVRKKPHLRSEKLFKVMEGTPLSIVKISNILERVGNKNLNWIQIQTKEGRSGYIYSSFTTPFAYSIGKNILLLGISEKYKNNFEFRLLSQKKKLLKKWTLESMPKGSTQLVLKKNYFGKNHHGLLMETSIGNACPVGYDYRIYSFYRNKLLLLRKKQGGADPPVASEYTYKFKKNAIYELKEDYEQSEENKKDFSTRTQRKFIYSKGRLVQKMEKNLLKK
ncbi:MAG: SH3 domain-containing protein [Spirochaetota bacterium]